LGWGKAAYAVVRGSAFAEASADEADKSTVPAWRPHPTLPREEREREREDSVRG